MAVLECDRLSCEPCLSAQPRSPVLLGDSLKLECPSESGFDRLALTKDDGPAPPRDLDAQHSPDLPLGHDTSAPSQANVTVPPVTSGRKGTWRCYGSNSASPYLLSHARDSLKLVVSGEEAFGLERKACLATLVCLCSVLRTGTGQPFRAEDGRPNIVLIMVDDLGIGDLGCYGNATMRTPNIDRLAREGVQLTHHISAAPICTPSRSAFLTGRYAIRSGMVSNAHNRVINTLGARSGLPLNETTFAAVVKKQGYRTGIIGKWHQGLNCFYRTDHCHHPNAYGFDYFYGMPYTLFDRCWPDPSRHSELAIGARLFFYVQMVAVTALAITVGNLSRLVSVPWVLVLFLASLVFLLSYFWYSSFTSSLYWDCILMRQHDITEQPQDAGRTGTIMLKEAISFLDRHREDPFLLFYSFLHVHTPLPTTEDFMGTSSHGLYGDNVQEMDFLVGKLLDAIDNLGLRNHTFVYLTSDHGGHLEARLGRVQLGGWNGIYKGGKGMAGWEGGIRVPGLVRWPGKLLSGRVIDEPTSLMDVLPTVAALTGGTVPEDRVVDGRNLLPLLLGEVQRSEHEFLFHYCSAHLHAVRWHPRDSDSVWKVHYVTPVFQPPGAGACYETLYCQCTGPLVTYHDPPLLFDLSRDPSESTPLSNSTEPLYDVVLATVAAALTEHRKTITPVEYQLQSKLNRDHLWLKPCCGVFPFCLCDKEGRGPCAKNGSERLPMQLPSQTFKTPACLAGDQSLDLSPPEPCETSPELEITSANTLPPNTVPFAGWSPWLSLFADSIGSQPRRPAEVTHPPQTIPVPPCGFVPTLVSGTVSSPCSGPAGVAEGHLPWTSGVDCRQQALRVKMYSLRVPECT
ncbi:arylsulfatase F-like [Rhynchonycteris naso]